VHVKLLNIKVSLQLLNFFWTSRCQYDPNSSPTTELEGTTRESLYHVAEHRPVRSESLQPHTERSSRSGSQLPSVEADVYVWRYALLVVHGKKEQEAEDPNSTQFIIYAKTNQITATWKCEYR